jgi:neutral ceramidase
MGNQSTPWLAGVSEVTITPPVGTPLLGPLQAATGVHDPLCARALVLGDGVERAALVCLDLVGLDFGLADDLRARIRERTGIGTVVLNCSHTHSAPFTIPWSVLGWQWLAGAGQAWRAGLLEKVTDTVARAALALTPVTLRVGRAPVQVGSNRRLPTPGGVAMAPNPQGAIVPWTDVLRLDSATGAPVAVLFSHAAHAVIVHAASTLISSDYPGEAVRYVRRHFGETTLALFAQACGANINGDPLQGGFPAAERAGALLGEAVVTAAERSEPLDATTLQARSVSAALPLQPLPSRAQCEHELRALTADATDAQKQDWYAQDSVLCLQDLLGKIQRRETPTLRFEATALAAGSDWCLLALTHEVFAEYQLWVDRVAPFRHTMTLAYTNGCESYIPTDEALRAGTGYEATAAPTMAAAMRYRQRLALRPGAEAQIRELIGTLWR